MIAVVGLVGCVALIMSLPLTAILTGTATLALGVAVRAITLKSNHRELGGSQPGT